MRKLTFIAAAIAAVASTGALANGQHADFSNQGQFGISGMYTSLTGTFMPELVFDNDIMSAGVGVNWSQFSDAGTDSQQQVITFKNHATNIQGHLGVRREVAHDVFAGLGVMGSTSFVGNKGNFQQNPYSVGAYIGLDYQPVQHLAVNAKIMPYSYGHSLTKGITTNRVFTEGVIGVTYYFN